MAPLLIGYARVSTDEQDLTAQREALAALGVSAERIYVDHGLTGTNRDRPGLREALAACRRGDTPVVAKLHPLPPPPPPARDILEDPPPRRAPLPFQRRALHRLPGRRTRRRRRPCCHRHVSTREGVPLQAELDDG